MEKDINEAFQDIFLCEEKLTQSSYEEGFLKGQSEGNPEGYHLGYHRGAEIGAELGYYLGVVQTVLKKTDNSDKVSTNLKRLERMITEYPKTNDENCDLIRQLDNIRAVYKKTCSLLKIKGLYPEADKMSF